MSIASSVADSLAFAFVEGQRRVPKGNDAGGQWVDDAGNIIAGLERYVGPQGAPMSIAEMKALPKGVLSRQINPGLFEDAPTEATPKLYRDDPFTRVEYMVNCQRVAVAVELKARGYDVVANGAPKLSHGQDWAPDGTPDDMALNWRQTREALPDGVAGQVGFGYPHPPDAARAQMLANNPIGSRFLVAGTWGGGAGHVWNAEVVDSPFGPQLVEVDAQTPMNLIRAGGSYTLDYGEDTFTEISYLRVDDKLPSDQLWRGNETSDYTAWVQTPKEFERENAAVRANPEHPWEYASFGGPFTFADAQRAVTAASGHPTLPTGFDAGVEWVVLVQHFPTLYNNVAWYVHKLTGEAVEASLHPGHGYPAVGQTTLTAAFSEAQERVAKGNREGGQWIDTAGRIADLLESKAGGLKAASKEYGRKPATGGTWPQLASKTALYKLPSKSKDAAERREYQDYLDSPGINSTARRTKAQTVQREESYRRERTRSWERFNEQYPDGAVNVAERVDADIAQLRKSDREALRALDGFIDRHGVVSEKPMTVLRGMQSNKDVFDVPGLFAPGKVFVDNGYLSTTFDPATMKLASAPPAAGGQLGFLADLFSVPTEPWTMQIQVPAGTKFVRGEGTQKELLFGRGTKMRVLAQNPVTRELIVEMVP